MRVIVSGGGTGGHLYPALAIGEQFQKLGAELHYVGAARGLEEDIVQTLAYPYHLLPVEGLRNKTILTLPKGLCHLMKAYRMADRIVKEFQPDLIIGTGGYASYPVLKAGIQHQVKTIIHEANAEMGKANLQLAADVDCLCLTYRETAHQIPNAQRILVTGMVMRESIKTATREEGGHYLDVDDSTLVVTVTGGSQGSRHINEAMIAFYEGFSTEKDILFYHITGKNNADQNALVSRFPCVRSTPYENRMELVLARSDLCVGRAGASFLAEISYLGIPAILIPYPFSHGHQEKNANYFQEKGAAKMVLDDDLPDGLHRDLNLLIKDGELRKTMSRKMRGESKADALDKIVEAGVSLINS